MVHMSPAELITMPHDRAYVDVRTRALYVSIDRPMLVCHKPDIDYLACDMSWRITCETQVEMVRPRYPCYGRWALLDMTLVCTGLTDLGATFSLSTATGSPGLLGTGTASTRWHPKRVLSCSTWHTRSAIALSRWGTLGTAVASADIWNLQMSAIFRIMPVKTNLSPTGFPIGRLTMALSSTSDSNFYAG